MVKKRRERLVEKRSFFYSAGRIISQNERVRQRACSITRLRKSKGEKTERKKEKRYSETDSV